MERAAYTKEQLAAYDKFKDAIMIEKSIINTLYKDIINRKNDEAIR